jgi:CDP-paratose 2-epimerase
MKLLITGGSGFLGSNLAAHALKLGWDLCVVDNLSRQGSVDNLGWLRSQGGFRFIHADTRNANDVARAVGDFRPEMLFHLAGQVAMTTSIANPRLDFETNALGTFNVLEAVRQYAPECGVIYSSTNKVYGDLEQWRYAETDKRYVCLDHPQGFGEEIPLEFHSPYGCSKGAADQYLLDYHRIFGLKTAVFRHSSMYGGRQFATADQGWVGWFCRMAIEQQAGVNKEFSIAGNGKQVRDLLHADDMVSLYFGAATRIDGVAGQAFNVGGGMPNSLSLLELFDLLGESIGRPLDFCRAEPRQSDQRVFVANIERISGAIGWRPEVSAREGVVRMLDWVRKSRQGSSA